ncbi:DNA-binding transcriptional MerR regulator [Rhodococcus sp. LBL1]|jgi:DNA-binding transcriptional MerR regulator|nr:DNA-binding transcriptional MerR regulator [Rhodococcus sp. LBL1]MDH6685175.1 DNA-binding transcriptional MerR regulator [Rhodococcus sp. LBL2]
MRIGELSRITGASVRMIRYYDSQGLMSPRRASNGYREFDHGDVKVVQGIRCLLDAGLRVEDARGFLVAAAAQNDPRGSREEVEQALKQFDERIAAVEAGIRKLQQEKAALTELRGEFANALPPSPQVARDAL